jgi:hypothetical protein
METSSGTIWGIITATVLVTDVIGGVLLSSAQQNFAYVSGELFVSLVLVGLAVGFVAKAMGSRWQPWWTAPLVVVPAIALHLGLHSIDVASHNASPTSRHAIGHVLSAPRHVGTWDADDSPRLRQAIAQVRSREKSSARTAGVRIVARGYSRPSGERAFFIGFNADAGSSFADELSASDKAVRNLLAGGGVTKIDFEDPGKLGGSLACGLDPANGAQVVMCGWADPSSAATVVVSGGVLTLEDAARLVTTLRTGLSTES